MTIVFEMIETNGVILHTAISGNSNDPLIILLHGFPEFWIGWRNQIDDIVNAGYYVLIPDQRGYNLSSKPWSIRSYKMSKLAQDIVGLIDWANKDKAIIAGHDWGAGVAWYLAQNFKERIEKTIIVNVPHSKVMLDTLRKNKRQRRKSWYILFFQLPFFPVLFLRKKNFKMLRNSLVKTSIKGTFEKVILSEYEKSWKQKRSVRSMVNWYRAALQLRTKVSENRVKIPLLIIWGKKDKFLNREMAEDSLEWCDNGRLEYLDENTHWILHEAPEKVNPIIVSFLKDSH